MLLNCQYFLKFFTSFFFSFFIILLLAKIAFFFLNRFDERYTLNSLKKHVIFIFLSTPKAELSESQNEEINEIYDGEYEQNRIKYTEIDKAMKITRNHTSGEKLVSWISTSLYGLA